MKAYKITCLITGKEHIVCSTDVNSAVIYVKHKHNLKFYTVDKAIMPVNRFNLNVWE